MEEEITTMGAANAIVDSTHRPNCSPCDGQRSEMDGLVSHYWPSFYRTAFRYLGNAADAEDAVQDALLSAYKHVSQFRRQARNIDLGDGDRNQFSADAVTQTSQPATWIPRRTTSRAGE